MMLSLGVAGVLCSTGCLQQQLCSHQEEPSCMSTQTSSYHSSSSPWHTIQTSQLKRCSIIPTCSCKTKICIAIISCEQANGVVWCQLQALHKFCMVHLPFMCSVHCTSKVQSSRHSTFLLDKL